MSNLLNNLRAVRDGLNEYDPGKNDIDAAIARIRELEAENAEIRKAIFFAFAEGCPNWATDGRYEQQLECLVMRAKDFDDRYQIQKAAGDDDPLSLIEAAKRLPKTADGKRAVLPCDLWHVFSEDGFVGPNSMFVIGYHDGMWYTPHGRTTFKMYSTREAAEAARDTNA